MDNNKPVNNKPPALSEASVKQDQNLPDSVRELTERNITLISEIEATAKAKRTITDRVVSQITGFCGHIIFVWAHLIWFGVWIGLNLTHFLNFDPYPFSTLTTTVALEAIFLSSLVLISQNKQALLIERRGHLDLQINLLAEQENTKILTIQEHLGIKDNQPDTAVLLEATQPASMFEQIELMMESDEKT
jgi:uncharacterized membrane protein